jgi:hypothetical protein
LLRFSPLRTPYRSYHVCFHIDKEIPRYGTATHLLSVTYEIRKLLIFLALFVFNNIPASNVEKKVPFFLAVCINAQSTEDLLQMTSPRPGLASRGLGAADFIARVAIGSPGGGVRMGDLRRDMLPPAITQALTVYQNDTLVKRNKQ